jgi:outer membrane protein
MHCFNLKKSVLVLALISTPVTADDLLTVYQQALASDPALQTAQLKVEIGSAQKGQSLGQMLPQVSATGNWSDNTQKSKQTNGPYTGTRYFVSLSQSLLDFAKFWDWRRASSVEDQYITEAIEAEHELMMKVVERYFNVLEAEDQVFFAKTEKEATQKQLEQVRKQFAKQMLKITDVYALEARLDQIIADEILAESQRITALETLKELTGTQPAILNKLRKNNQYKELDGDVLEWLEVAKAQNPSVAALAIAIEAAEKNVAVQKSKYMPVVDLQLNYYDTNTGYQNISLASATKTETAAINVTVPLFNGGVTTHQLFEAQHRVSVSRNEHEAGTRTLIKEVSDSFLTANAKVRQIQAGEKSLDSASKNFEAMERGFHYGVVTISDVIKAEQGVFMAKRDLSQARYAFIKNRIRFMRAIGSLSVENLQEVNAWLE